MYIISIQYRLNAKIRSQVLTIFVSENFLSCSIRSNVLKK